MFDIQSGPLLPWHFRLLGLLMVLFVPVLAAGSIILIIILELIGLTMIFSFEGTQIDPGAKRYREYTSILFLKSGKFMSYSGVERIFIVTSKINETMHSARANNTLTFEKRMFDAYIVFTPENKIHLVSDKSKERVMKKITPLSQTLQVSVVDHTK